MTPILGETEDGVKKTRTDSKILPHVVIYDVDLTLSLPARMSASSGVNAIAHAGELKLSRATQCQLDSTLARDRRCGNV
jgi:diphthamide biosynthesis protein 2